MNEKNNIDINFGAILDSIIKKLWVILLAAVIAAGAAFAYVRFFVDPVYDSTATLYIGNAQDGANSTEISLQNSLAKDYEEIISRPVVLESVINNLGLDMNYGQLSQCVSVNNVTNTRLLDITVSTTDPELSKSIADSICSVASEQFVSIVKYNYVSIVDEGSMSAEPSNINYTLSMFLAGFAGILISVFCIMVRTIMDDKIKTPDDIERYLGLSVLGTMPFNKNLESGNTRKRSHRKRTTDTSSKKPVKA